MKKIISKDLLFKILDSYYFDNLTITDISKKYNISRNKVFKTLENARKNNLVKITINDPEEDLRNMERLAEKEFGIKECIIVRSSINENHIFKLAKALESFLDRNIDKNTKIGIGWGKTLAFFASNLSPKNIKNNIEVIPLVGGLGNIENELSTNMMTNLVAKAYGGKNYLINFPGIIKDNYIKEIIMEDKHIKEIFKKFDEIDIAFVGLSSISSSATNLIDLGYVTYNDYQELGKLGIIGDINLNFIDSDGNFVKNFLSDRIINAGIDILKKINTVVVAASGSHKVPVVVAALKNKLFNVLISDEDTVKEIMRFKKQNI
ncbi:MAG: hypothetical protein M1326_08400 [Cyanobacteria bacterium]|nr:hypothetical protein [Cyanobacteriota bacterium]